MSLNDLVSVVIPTYNSEKFLRESIESVLNQTYQNLEIIVVDDGSTDTTNKILKNFSEKIITVYQTNQGLASALNSGIKKMKGNWFKWFSPDDVFYPHAIEKLVKTAKKLPINTIVYSNWDIIDEKNNKIRTFSESNYNSLDKFDFNVRLLDGQLINVNTALFPSPIFELGCKIRDLKDPVAIDYDFFLRAGILFDFKFHLIPESFIGYRIHKKQLSHENISRTLSFVDELKNEILSELDENKRKKYIQALEDYKKQKPIAKKTMELGLKFATKNLPDSLTDKFVLFYLNKIRRTR